VAVVLLTGTAKQPAIELMPSVNVTVPVGTRMPARVGVSVAVKVTEFPALDGFSDEVTLVVVEAMLTICTKVFEVLALKFAAPE
jgi:hypothetical protein